MPTMLDEIRGRRTAWSLGLAWANRATGLIVSCESATLALEAHDAQDAAMLAVVEAAALLTPTYWRLIAKRERGDGMRVEADACDEVADALAALTKEVGSETVSSQGGEGDAD